MGLRLQPSSCERARAWVSLRLDDELSELEERLLEAHLESCASCRELEATVCGAVLALRAQALEQMDHPVVVAGRRRLSVGRGAMASVAAVAAAVVGVTAVLGTTALKSPSSHSPAPLPAAVASDDQDLKQLRTLRVLQLGGRPPRTAGVGSFGAVTNRQLGPS